MLNFALQTLDFALAMSNYALQTLDFAVSYFQKTLSQKYFAF
jgi:hypothetical protein